MEKDKSLRYTLYLLIITFILVVNLWTGWVFEMEKKVTMRLQHADLVKFANFVSDRFLIGSMVFYYIITYNLESFRPRFYFEALLGMAGIALISMLKLLFAQGRPYQKYLEIKPLACECDYGMPSGHSFTAAMVSFLFYTRCVEWLWKTR